MDKRIRISIACFLGGGIGTLVAISVATWLWWVGLLVGAFVGYVAYEFRQVVQAVQQAWQVVYSTDWRKAVAWLRGSYTFLLTLVVFLLSSMVWPIVILHVSGPLKDGLHVVVWLTSATVVSAFVGFFGWTAVVGLVELKPLGWVKFSDNLKDSWFILFTSPIGMWVIMPILLVGEVLFLAGWTMWYLISRTPKFVWIVFRQIHSDIRLLCGVDAAIGAAIGYHFQLMFMVPLLAVLVGGVVGAVVGVLNFELVSKRWLKVVPLAT